MENPIAKDSPTKRVLIGIPMTGMLRSEWHWSQKSLVTPTNWSQGVHAQRLPNYSPLGFSVANARNIVVDKAVKEEWEWLFFNDHDVIMPPETLIKFNQRMLSEKLPVWGGLYFTKSFPAEPLIYRGRGNSYFTKWKLGDEVWCDGMGLGCHMISVKLLKLMWEDSEEYEVQRGIRVRRVFHSPAVARYDPEGKFIGGAKGTEDLPWYERIMEQGYLKKAGWPQLQRKKYPFLCDTSVFCRHIDWNGTQYPAHGEEEQFK